MVGSPCSPRDSQESSPTPQFKGIHSSALSFLYSPTLTSIHDYWENHSFDWMDLCWQSNVCFLICYLGNHSFSSKEQASFNFMAALTICSDFGAPKIKSVTVSIVSPSICHEVMGLVAMIFQPHPPLPRKNGSKKSFPSQAENWKMSCLVCLD